MSLLAIAWEPEIRGLLTVVIAVVILMGSIYLILATNMGARLAFLVTLTALFGWMMLMGISWLIYGIGLRGPDPTWAAVPGATVLQDDDALVKAGVLPTLPQFPDDSTPAEDAEVVAASLLDEGYVLLDKASPAFGQAEASASAFLEEEGAFAAGQFEIVAATATRRSTRRSTSLPSGIPRTTWSPKLRRSLQFEQSQAVHPRRHRSTKPANDSTYT